MLKKKQPKNDKVLSVRYLSLAYISQYQVVVMNNSSKVYEIIYIQARPMIKLQTFFLIKFTQHFLNTKQHINAFIKCSSFKQTAS